MTNYKPEREDRPTADESAAASLWRDRLRIYADEELGIAAKTCRAIGLAEAEGTKHAKKKAK